MINNAAMKCSSELLRLGSYLYCRGGWDGQVVELTNAFAIEIKVQGALIYVNENMVWITCTGSLVMGRKVISVRYDNAPHRESERHQWIEEELRALILRFLDATCGPLPELVS